MFYLLCKGDSLGYHRGHKFSTRDQEHAVRLSQLSLCSDVQRWLVVQQLSLLQPERPLLPHRQLHSGVRGRSGVESVERQVVLAEIHWNENQTVLICELNDNILSIFLSWNIMCTSCTHYININYINNNNNTWWSRYTLGYKRQGAPIKSSPYNHLLITHQRFQLILWYFARVLSVNINIIFA